MDKLCSYVSELGGSRAGPEGAASVFLSECICNPILAGKTKRQSSLHEMIDSELYYNTADRVSRYVDNLCM